MRPQLVFIFLLLSMNLSFAMEIDDFFPEKRAIYLLLSGSEEISESESISTTTTLDCEKIVTIFKGKSGLRFILSSDDTYTTKQEIIGLLEQTKSSVEKRSRRVFEINFGVMEKASENIRFEGDKNYKNVQLELSQFEEALKHAHYHLDDSYPVSIEWEEIAYIEIKRWVGRYYEPALKPVPHYYRLKLTLMADSTLKDVDLERVSENRKTVYEQLFSAQDMQRIELPWLDE